MNKSVLILLLFISVNVWGQNQSEKLVLTFDKVQNDEQLRAQTALTQSTTTMLAHTPTYTKGLIGNALDLTSDVALRIPEILTKDQQPMYDANSSFAIQVWVQTKKNAKQGTPVISTKNANDNKSAGWRIGTKANGAWYWHMSDGNQQYDYEPTAERQAINDGQWHQITVSYNRDKKELWLYFDGRNVAIYQIADEIKSLESELRTVIGGADEYNDWGSRGEWMAFNGKIDELRMWNRSLTVTEVTNSYNKFFPSSQTELLPDNKLKVQVWNIWHGGHRFGEHIGVERTIEVLKQQNADVIGLIETYGSGAIIADSLGYYFYLISSNLSIMSRYPINETIKLFRPFNSGGALIDLGSGQQLAFLNIWLHYLPDMCDLHKGKTALKTFIAEEEKTRLSEIKSILKDAKQYTQTADKTPVIIMGDFNCDSHLDWTAENKVMHNGVVYESAISKAMIAEGYTDSFRKLHPNAAKAPGYTWSPLINIAAQKPDCTPSRIDFIYCKGTKLNAYQSQTFDYHPVFWPSDHGSVSSSFYIN